MLAASLAGKDSWEGSQPGGFSAKIVVSTQEVKLPDQLTIELELSYPEAYSIDSEALQDNLLNNQSPGKPPFTLDSIKSASSLENGMVADTKAFALEPNLEGRFPLTFLNITFLPKDHSKKPVEILSDVFFVDVKLPIGKKEAEFSAAPLLDLTETLPIELSASMRSLRKNRENAVHEAMRVQKILDQKRLPWKIFIVLIIIGFGIFYFKKKKPNKPIELEEPLSMAAYRQALENLELLKNQKNVDPIVAQAFAIHLVNSVRYHFEEKFHLSVSSKTTQEFLREFLQNPTFDENMRSSLNELLLVADQIKFARYHPSIEECFAAKKARNVLVK